VHEPLLFSDISKNKLVKKELISSDTLLLKHAHNHIPIPMYKFYAECAFNAFSGLDGEGFIANFDIFDIDILSTCRNVGVKKTRDIFDNDNVANIQCLNNTTFLQRLI